MKLSSQLFRKAFYPVQASGIWWTKDEAQIVIYCTLVEVETVFLIKFFFYLVALSNAA